MDFKDAIVKVTSELSWDLGHDGYDWSDPATVYSYLWDTKAADEDYSDVRTDELREAFRLVTRYAHLTYAVSSLAHDLGCGGDLTKMEYLLARVRYEGVSGQRAQSLQSWAVRLIRDASFEEYARVFVDWVAAEQTYERSLDTNAALYNGGFGE